MTAFAVLSLFGCGSTTQVGHTFYLGTDRMGREIIGNQCWERGEWARTCNTVQVTNNPADEEFWQFEARLKVRALIGIPYGRMPQDYNVIGTRETCEAVRARVTDPTEPCKGPFYFRRVR